MKTSFRISKSLYDLENIILSQMDIPRTVFHRRMIDYFIETGGAVTPRLLITRKADPDYVKRESTEQIYLDDVRRDQLERIAQKNGCRIGTVLFQAMLSYCCSIAPSVLGDMSRYIKDDNE